jgi:hypothetical protein
MFYYISTLYERKKASGAMTDTSTTTDDTSGARERAGERGAARAGAARSGDM